MAIEAGVDADFAEQLFRVLLTETHRIEVAGHRPDPAPEKAPEGRGTPGLDTVASRVDHVVVAVPDLAAARRSLSSGLGFHEVPLAEPAEGVAAMAAGGVTIVLVGAEASPAVARHLARHGGGVQHIAIEVLNAGYTRAALAEAGARALGMGEAELGAEGDDEEEEGDDDAAAQADEEQEDEGSSSSSSGSSSGSSGGGGIRPLRNLQRQAPLVAAG